MPFFSRYIPRRRIAGSWSSSIFHFWEISILFSTVAAPVHIPTVYEGSLFSTSLPTFVICVIFDSSHSDRCEMISHCGFYFHFPDDKQCWGSFHMLVSHLQFLFGKVCIQFCPFFNRVVCLVLSCMISLDMLNINLLLVIWSANIFPHSVGCLFIHKNLDKHSLT